MTDVDVLGYLNSKGLQLRRASGNEVHLACFFHGEDPGARGRLYVNVDPSAEIPGLFECKVCGERGAFPTIQKHFGDYTRDTPIEDDVHLIRREIIAIAADFYHEQLGENEEAFQWLRGPERGLEVETIIEKKVGYAPGGQVLYRHLKDRGYKVKDILDTGLIVEAGEPKRLQDSLAGMVTIPYFTAGNVVMIRGRAWPFDGKGPKYKTCGGNSTRLYNSDATWDTEELVVCEGEFDAMVMEQIGFPSVGVPGANVWQDAWDGYVSALKRIWLVFDRDAAGEKGAEKLSGKFGQKVRRIHLSEPGQKCDPTSWVGKGNTAADFALLIEQAAKGGLLITVDEAFAEHAELQGQPGIKFGCEQLDLMIEPGLLGGQVCVVLAKAGTGKTVFLLNTMQRMTMVPGQENMRFLFISLEQTRGEWWERAKRIHRFYNLDSDEGEALNFWRERILITDKNRLREEQIVQVLEDYQYRTGSLPDCIMLDYLGYFAQSFKGERYERVSDAVMALKAIGKDIRKPIITPHQVSRVAKYGEEPDTDAARDAGVVEETADFLFTLWSPDAQLGRAEEEKSGVISLRIGKSRHGGRGVKVDFQFAPLSLALVPHSNGPSSPHLRMARMELEWDRRFRDKWEQAVYRHQTGFDGELAKAGHQPALDGGEDF